MRPLNVALIHRDSWARHERIDGQFAYPVPEFGDVYHITVEKAFALNLNALCGHFDLAWLDDGKYKPRKTNIYPPPGHRAVPLACYVLYPTLSDSIYQSRRDFVGAIGDLVLIDHDDLARWSGEGLPPARRCAYSVDEHRYKPLAKTVDVGFYCIWNYNRERRALNDWLARLCKRRGWTFGTNQGMFTREYARMLGESRVIVHINRTARTRPPRIFDAAACGAAFVGNPVPPVSGEAWRDGVHYVAVNEPRGQYDENDRDAPDFGDGDLPELAAALERLIDGGEWRTIAEAARDYVLTEHTWAKRAAYLRRVLREVLGI